MTRKVKNTYILDVINWSVSALFVLNSFIIRKSTDSTENEAAAAMTCIE